jgi:hypothetical protein
VARLNASFPIVFPDGTMQQAFRDYLSTLSREYMVPIWAEENATLNDGGYEWAFGNGANSPSNAGIAIYVPLSMSAILSL